MHENWFSDLSSPSCRTAYMFSLYFGKRMQASTGISRCDPPNLRVQARS